MNSRTFFTLLIILIIAGTLTVLLTYDTISNVTYSTISYYSTLEKQCDINEISASGQCISYTISGATIINGMLNTKYDSLIININCIDDGTLTISPETVIDDIFMILVDGEEWNDVEIVANKVTIMFFAGTEQIEIIGTFVNPII